MENNINQLNTNESFISTVQTINLQTSNSPKPQSRFQDLSKSGESRYTHTYNNLTNSILDLLHSPKFNIQHSYTSINKYLSDRLFNTKISYKISKDFQSDFTTPQKTEIYNSIHNNINLYLPIAILHLPFESTTRFYSSIFINNLNNKITIKIEISEF